MEEKGALIGTGVPHRRTSLRTQSTYGSRARSANVGRRSCPTTSSSCRCAFLRTCGLWTSARKSWERAMVVCGCARSAAVRVGGTCGPMTYCIMTGCKGVHKHKPGRRCRDELPGRTAVQRRSEPLHSVLEVRVRGDLPVVVQKKVTAERDPLVRRVLQQRRSQPLRRFTNVALGSRGGP